MSRVCSKWQQVKSPAWLNLHTVRLHPRPQELCCLTQADGKTPCQRVGILYSTWHWPAYTAQQIIASHGYTPLNIEMILNSRLEQGALQYPPLALHTALHHSGFELGSACLKCWQRNKANACYLVWLCAVNGSAQYGAYTLSQAINNNHGLNVNGQAMNFYWQHTPQARYWVQRCVHMLPTTDGRMCMFAHTMSSTTVNCCREDTTASTTGEHRAL